MPHKTLKGLTLQTIEINNLSYPNLLAQRLVVTAGVPVGQPGMTNLLKIVEIENA